METVTVGKPWRYLLGGQFADAALFRSFIKPARRAGGDDALGLVPADRAVVEALPGTEKPSPEGIPPADAGSGARSFAGIMPDGHSCAISYITSCRNDNRLLYVSPQVSRLGYMPETLRGVTDFRLLHVHDEDMAHFDRAFVDSCAAVHSFDCKYRLAEKSGRVHWFHDVASVICDEKGKPLLLKGVMLDITDKKEMEAELEQHRYYLERNVEMRTAQLMKRVDILESCNRALCERLSAHAFPAAGRNVAPDQPAPGTAWTGNAEFFSRVESRAA